MFQIKQSISSPIFKEIIRCELRVKLIQKVENLQDKMSHVNIILLFDIEKLLYCNQKKSYLGLFVQNVKELLWEDQQLDYDKITSAYSTVLSTMAILTADPKLKQIYTPELSTIAKHKVANKILVVLWYNSGYNPKIDQCIRSKLHRIGTPENFIIDMTGQSLSRILDECVKKFHWSPYCTSLIKFQDDRAEILDTITLKEV